MAIKLNEREYRNFVVKVENDNEDYKVKGYASTFDKYVLFQSEGIDYCERIEPDAFNDADMSDVVFLYNHEGMVYARQKNGTLNLSIDDHGLLSEADLSSTSQSRELYDAIKTGLIDQMSFAFTVAEDEWDRDTHTRIIKRIGKVYDVSAVSIPANPNTDIATISARSYFDGVIEMEKAERLEEQRQLELSKAKYLYQEV